NGIERKGGPDLARWPRLGAPRIYERTNNRRASPVVAGEARLHRIPTSVAGPALNDLWRINSPCLSYRQAFFIAGIRLPRVAPQTARHCINSRLVPTKREVALFSRRCSRAIYTPFLSAAGLES